jgi:hypothetical protein
MKRALLTIVPAIALIGGVQAWAADAPADPSIPPYTEPIVPRDELIFHEPGTFEFAPPATTDGIGYTVETAITTPQHDQCWRNDNVNILLESGTFVIYGNDDPRRWGTHSIGGMNCGPADLPFPEPAPTADPAAAAVPQYDATGESCD